MSMFEYDFMINAFIASTLVALAAGVAGFFLIIRNQTFAGHALSHIGFTGATGAVLIGLSPSGGLIAATVAGGIAMGLLGEKLAGKDMIIGLILSFSLGLGMLFLHYFTAYATQATSLLFGNVLAVNTNTLWVLGAISLASLLLFALISNPLIFTSLQPELAEAKGISHRLVSAIFLGTVALVTAACVQIVGALLVFTLMIGPAATAQLFSNRLKTAIVLSMLFALLESWLGIAMAFYVDWPTSFCITAFSTLLYVTGLIYQRVKPKSQQLEAAESSIHQHLCSTSARP